MVGTDGGPNTSHDIGRFGSILFLHSMDGLSGDIAQRAHPAGMGQADHAPARAMHQDRDTIGEAHVEGQLWFVCEDDIGLSHGLSIWPRRSGADHIRTVYLPDVEDRGSVSYTH